MGEMLRATNLGDEGLIAGHEKHMAGRRLIQRLMAQRLKRDVSQKDMASKMGCTQSRVSKLEIGADDDLHLGEIRQYLEALDLGIRVSIVPKEFKLVDQIKYHAIAIQSLLGRVVEFANGPDHDIAMEAAKFAAIEVPMNLAKTIVTALAAIPEDVIRSLGNKEDECALNSEDIKEVGKDGPAGQKLQLA